MPGPPLCYSIAARNSSRDSFPGSADCAKLEGMYGSSSLRAVWSGWAGDRHPVIPVVRYLHFLILEQACREAGCFSTRFRAPRSRLPGKHGHPRPTECKIVRHEESPPSQSGARWAISLKPVGTHCSMHGDQDKMASVPVTDTASASSLNFFTPPDSLMTSCTSSTRW